MPRPSSSYRHYIDKFMTRQRGGSEKAKVPIRNQQRPNKTREEKVQGGRQKDAPQFEMLASFQSDLRLGFTIDAFEP